MNPRQDLNYHADIYASKQTSRFSFMSPPAIFTIRPNAKALDLILNLVNFERTEEENKKL